MLYPHEAYERTSFGFKYLSAPSQPLRLISIGWEHVNSPSYRWHGLHRGGGFAIFQYTLSGRGMFRDGERTFALPKETGFFTVVPSDQEYYYPEGGEGWEFLYVLVAGTDALNHWTELTRAFGPVLSLQGHQEPVRLLSQLYAEICRQPQLDKYTISARLYEWLMSLHRLAEGRDIVRGTEELPDSMRAAVKLMKGQYMMDLSVDDLAEAAGLTKYHFCRQFLKKTGLKPNQYLRKIRVEQAAWLLRHTDKTVDAVARETGFGYTNYFIKVFRSFVGATPQEYRLGQRGDPVYFLRIEP
ncbi:AraC family transcriptional regulator [Paenibacillus filicis]|uniref:AraC family transcriptional regulator n=1 Tax=Paenibacillus gyeongsangnamensis TaxID=3388067 RepID=A0ABT4QBB0_9BACL|nr:AraC family transcriptional regulator [Paenibacillus filicis]MCZ8514108.1 AraC family transcriptional regulator [Paenibacillus filicis]